MLPQDPDPSPVPVSSPQREVIEAALPPPTDVVGGWSGTPTQFPAGGQSDEDRYSAPLTAVGRRGSPGSSTIRAAVVVVAILAGSALFISGYSLGRHVETTPGTPASEEKAFQPFWDTYRAITDKYAGGPVDHQKIVEGAIKGMFEALGDPYSAYLTPDEYRQTLQGISGQFEGIGAEIGTRTADGKASDCTTLGANCLMVIVSPIDGAPAAKAGVQAGDVVTKIDGVGVDGMTTDDTVKKVRGPKGTKIVLTLIRGKSAPFDVTITRDVIVEQEVTTKDLGGGSVRYIKITGFSDHAASDVVTAVGDGIKAGEKKFILDLRGNPGGFVTAATRVASQFIGSGPIFWEEDAQGHDTETDATSGGLATDPSIKLVVLIDRGSASASEIVAGALQDTKRATLVGETSFGKGTVQIWQELGGDTGGFRLTVAKWLTPNKHWIHHKGLTPDVAVTVPADNPPGKDPVLDKALSLLGAPTAGSGGLERAA